MNTVLALARVGIRLGFSAGLVCGLVIGLVGGLGGSIFTSTLPDLATFAIGTFWLLLLALPLLYARNLSLFETIVNATNPADPARRGWIGVVTAIAWLPAYLASVVAFMIPVVMAPFVLNKGVTFDNAAHWYDQVYTPLLNGPVIWVGIATIFGFAAVAYLMSHRQVPNIT
jgi:hypothetical protein